MVATTAPTSTVSSNNLLNTAKSVETLGVDICRFNLSHLTDAVKKSNWLLVFFMYRYSLLLISNKFWMGMGERWGVGGGEARGPSWRGENKRGGMVEG
jgi:hypothetical protein